VECQQPVPNLQEILDDNMFELDFSIRNDSGWERLQEILPVPKSVLGTPSDEKALFEWRKKSVVFNRKLLLTMTEEAINDIWWRAYEQWYEEQMKKFFDAFPMREEYEEDYYSPSFFDDRLKGDWLRLLKAEVDFEGKSVLDVACGDGAISIAAKQNGASRVLGIDLSGKSLDKARANARRHGVKVSFHRKSITQIPSISERFDIVISAQVLTYMPPKLREWAIKRGKAVLKEGGELILYEPFVWGHNKWGPRQWTECLISAGFNDDLIKLTSIENPYSGTGLPYCYIIRASYAPANHDKAGPEKPGEFAGATSL